MAKDSSRGDGPRGDPSPTNLVVRADSSEATLILLDLSSGNRAQVNRLFELLYEELHGLAEAQFRGERHGHTLQPTVLVHEAYLKLIDQQRVQWQNRAHFKALAAQAMRRYLIDYSRRRTANRRGGIQAKVEFSEDYAFSQDRPEDVLLLDQLLTRLQKLDARHAQILELRFFGGLTVEEVGEVLQVSRRTVEADWTLIRAWLRVQMNAPVSAAGDSIDSKP